MVKHWDLFLAPYKQAVEELKVKLKGMRAQFEMLGAFADRICHWKSEASRQHFG